MAEKERIKPIIIRDKENNKVGHYEKHYFNGR